MLFSLAVMSDTQQAGEVFFFCAIIMCSIAFSAFMTSLVHGIPNNSSKKFNTFDEAVRAYSESVLIGSVRRVRTVINPQGHVYV